LRYMGSGTMLGDSLDNLIAPPFARQRPGYSAWNDLQEDVPYGLHEFLELSEAVGSEPWFVVPVVFSVQEMKNLIEYLGGSAETVYGKKRAARGRTRPWTTAFSQIHLEFANVAWNSVFKGVTLENPIAYGSRGGELFRAARSTPGFVATRYDLVLGGQAGWPGRNEEILKAASDYDSLTIAPYLLNDADQFSTNEELFGPLFAEAQMMSESGYARQNFHAAARRGGKPLSIYEVNLHTTGGAISQQGLDQLAPSGGAGVAVVNHMLMMLRELGAKNQMLFQLAQQSFKRGDGKGVKLWGSVVDMGRTNRKRPQFLAMQLANSALMGNMVATVHEGSNPTWNQPLMNHVELRNARYLQSYAFRDGQSRSLLMVNLSRTDPLSVAFSDRVPTGAVVVRQLRSRAITDNNEETESVAIHSWNTTAAELGKSVSLPPFSITVLTWRDTLSNSTFDVWGSHRPRAERKGGPGSPMSVRAFANAE
ncbi:MAG: hypothetical protein H7039_08890, partial [Bryobacteraceae bacterium]|nr:hypothetical protein [Bryobacteraceae bacterium]